MSDKKVIVVGTISNASADLRKNLLRVIKSLQDFEVSKIFLVESDSTDATVAVLENLRDELENFDFLTLGSLKHGIPDRINRIRYCRNLYVKEIRELLKSDIIDYVVIADLDGMNTRITPNGIRSSITKGDWGAVIANQLGGYYDLLALRHPTWCPQDVMVELRTLQSRIDKTPLPFFSFIRRTRRRLSYDQARRTAIYSKMKLISRRSPWIKVDSGFGGFGIYQASIFKNFDYSVTNRDLEFESEHVALSKRITESGLAIYINPRMINNYFNTYNINRYFVIRQIRQIYWNSSGRFRNLRGN